MRILIIEDNDALCEMVTFHLTQEGYTVDTCTDGDDGLHWARQQAHGLILLDRMLPVMNGISVLKWLREEGVSTPVLILTALGTIQERVEGLDAGADDYLVKPFAVEELLARVRAMCRRPQKIDLVGLITIADVTFDAARSSLLGKLGACRLSARELRLAEVLFQNMNQTIPRSILLARVWGPDAGVEEGNLESYIYFLRRHLLAVGSNLQIKTMRGVGYMLEVPDD